MSVLIFCGAGVVMATVASMLAIYERGYRKGGEAAEQMMRPILERVIKQIQEPKP